MGILIRLRSNKEKKFDQEEEKTTAQGLYIGHRSSLFSPCAFARSLGLFTRSSCSGGFLRTVRHSPNTLRVWIDPRGRLGHGLSDEQALLNYTIEVNTLTILRIRPGRWDFFHLVGRRRAHACRV